MKFLGFKNPWARFGIFILGFALTASLVTCVFREKKEILPELDLRIAFGYKDARPARFVGDRVERFFLLDILTSPCAEGQLACGFQRDPSDADLFSKTISAGKFQRSVRLRLSASSVGPDDVANRADPYQQWQSEQGEANFISGLEGADLVLYIGHSRDGGGPAFTPPKIKANEHVDYDYYIRTREGAKKMIAALRKTKRPPQVAGLLSCYSERHFVQALSKAAPKMKIITSDQLLYVTDALLQAQTAVEEFLKLSVSDPTKPHQG